jgi:hypothetical protein
VVPTPIIKHNFDDVGYLNAAIQQMLLEQVEQQVGLSATTDSSNNLDQMIVFVRDEFLQVFIAIKFYHTLTFAFKKWKYGQFL